MKPTKDHNKSGEQKFHDMVMDNLQKIDQSMKQGQMNHVAIARAMGISPKKFVKALYEDEKNKAFYIQTMSEEHKLMVRNTVPKIKLTTIISNKLKGMFMSEPKLMNYTMTQEDLDNNPQLVEEGIQVGQVIQIPKPKRGQPVEFPKGASKEDILTEEQKNANADAAAMIAGAPHADAPVVFEGKEVISILQDGRETADAYHCQMSDGTTMHVPKSLFNK